MSAATSSRSSATSSRSAIGLVREKMREDVKARAHLNAEERVLEALVGKTASPATRDSFRKKLRDGELDDKEIEIEVADTGNGGMPSFEIPGMPGANIGVLNINDMLSKAMGGKRTKTRKTTVKESYALLISDESDKLLDQDEVVREAIESTENDGIVFLDEIDKIAVARRRHRAPAFRAKACSATCCRWSKAPRSRPNTGR